MDGEVVDLYNKFRKLSKRQEIVKIKIGSPFPFMAISYGYLSVFIGILLIIFTSLIFQLLGIFLIALGLLIILIRNEFWIDINSQQLRNTKSILGLTYGNWQLIQDYKAVTIKYTLLSDKNNAKHGGAGLATQVLTFARFSENQYNKEETWLVHLYSNKNEKIQILNTNKTDALRAIIYLLNISDNIKPYLANCRPEFELNKAHLSKGQLTILNPKPIANRR